MKSQSTLSLFCCFLILFSLIFSTNCNKSKNQMNSSTTNTNKQNNIQGYFWIQRFYPGNDPIDNVKESEFHTRQMFFELNNEMIFFSKSLERIQDIEDSISLIDLYDPKKDDLDKGFCCSRIKYHQFPAAKGMKSILIATAHNGKKGTTPKITMNTVNQCGGNCGKNPITSVSKPVKEISKSKQSPVANANSCIDLYVPDEARWRICSSSQDKISKLHMKIVFHIASLKLKGRASAIANVLTNAKAGREPSVPAWTWNNQDKWGGTCASTFMQSPININLKTVTKAQGVNFKITHHLLPVHTLIKRNEKEVIVAFMNFGGIFQISIDNTYLMFTPVYMSFRFPGEHTIDGDRKLGEILIHFAELSNQRKTSTTNGLIFSIPVQPTAEGLEIESFEQLNIDFWKYEISKHGTYTPKKFLKKKLLPFDLPLLLKKVTDLKPNLYFYFGSHTTPPCSETTYHLVVNKPLNIAGCQFKLLRDNSLFSNRAKDIHARVEKPISDRTVYTLSSANFLHTKTISGIVPQSFNKYLLLHGYKYKNKLWAKKGWGKNGKGGRGKGANPWSKLFKHGPGDEWLDELNCDVPKN